MSDAPVEASVAPLDPVTLEPKFSGGVNILNVVHSFLENSGKKIEVAALSPRLCHLTVPMGDYVLFVPDENSPDLDEQLKQILKPLADFGGAVVLLGGSHDVFNAARQAAPRFTTKAIRIVHLQDDGEVIQHPKPLRTPPVFGWLKAAEPGAGACSLDRIARELESSHEDRAASVQAVAQLHTVTPWATYALLLAIAIVYGGQTLWGSQAALRMGALSSELVSEGQYYRLLSVGFLHGDFFHAAINSVVLLILGIQIERILGSARFLVLYWVSLLGGSLMSMTMLGDKISVGASGAVWGLLVAQACVAFGRPKILPDKIARTMQMAAMQNLGINVFASFRENVDWAAHAGGGIAGGLLLVSGLGAIGLSQDRFSVRAPKPLQTPVGYRVLAALAVITMLLAVGVAQLKGEPWKLKEPLSYRQVEVSEVGVSVNVPTTLEPKLERDEERGSWTLTFGDAYQEVALADVSFFNEPGISRANAAQALEEEVLPMMEPPSDAKNSKPFKMTTLGKHPALAGGSTFENGAEQQVWILGLDGLLVRLDLFCIEPGNVRCARPEEVLGPLL